MPVTVQVVENSVVVEETTIATVSVATQGPAGPAGAKGDTGEAGAQGDPGEGVPASGLTGQLLAKASATDYDTEWIDPPSGLGDVVGPGSAVSGNLVAFDGATGKLVQDAGVSASSFATAGQGSLADSAVQPGDLAAVATSGAYSDLSGAPSLATVATSGAYSDLSGTPSLGTAAALDVPSSGDAASGEVVKGDDSRLSDARTPTAHTHDDRYYTEAEVDSALGGKANASHSHAISDVTNLQSALDGKADTGHTHTLSDITDAGTAAASDTGDFATAAQGALADTAVQPGDDADTLGSGAATDGHVLTADGAGGAAWEAVPGASAPTQSFIIACSDETTDLTTGTAKVTFRMPFAFTLTGVRASVTTAPTGANLVVDINEGGVSILSTVLSIDAGEKTSTTAATAAVISDSSLADDAEITIDIDQVGSTVAGTGLKVTLIGTKT